MHKSAGADQSEPDARGAVAVAAVAATVRATPPRARLPHTSAGGIVPTALTAGAAGTSQGHQGNARSNNSCNLPGEQWIAAPNSSTIGTP